MKRTILATLFFAGIFTASFSQDKKIEFGLQGGYSYSMPKETTRVTSLNGFHVGPIISYNINETLGVQTGILYNSFSAITLLTSADIKKNIGNWNQNRTTAQYLDMPLRFQYSVSLADEMFIKLLIGPNLNYGVSKKMYYESYAKNELRVGYPETKNNYYESADYSRFDLQFGVGVALQYYGFSIRAGYDWGLLDRDKTTNSFKANDIKVGVAYTF